MPVDTRLLYIFHVGYQLFYSREMSPLEIDANCHFSTNGTLFKTFSLFNIWYISPFLHCVNVEDDKNLPSSSLTKSRLRYEQNFICVSH